MNTQQTGVGPHPQPWPHGDQYDPVLLRDGDSRNVLDKYHYWTVEAIKANLDTQRLPLEVAVENLERDFNMGTIIRNANAFNVTKVHIIGRRQWNKRGSMATDLYMNIEYHDSVEAFMSDIVRRDRHVVAVDIVPGAKNIHEVSLPMHSVLVFGAEGSGLSQQMIDAAKVCVQIQQFGSTRSVNVGVASGVAMYVWVHQNVLTHHL